MVVAVGESESNNEIEKNGISSSLPEEKIGKFRITVEPLGFLVLTATIIQVNFSNCYLFRKFN